MISASLERLKREPQKPGKQTDHHSVEQADGGFPCKDPAHVAALDVIRGQASNNHCERLGAGVSADPGHQRHEGG